MEHCPAEGAIFDGNIRYVMIRPDVLMGTARQLGQGGADFLAALEESAFQNAQASFATYRESDRFGEEDFLASACGVANKLGWGLWSASEELNGTRVVRVDNSPFAEGYGTSGHPVCAPIKGVLRAIALIGYGQSAIVQETACVAQGAQQCSFHLSHSKQGK